MKTPKKKPPIQTLNKDANSIFLWTLFAYFVFFIFNSLFKTGLFNGYTVFFENSIYATLFLNSLIFFIFSFFFIFNKDPLEVSNIFQICIWLMPLSFLLAYYFSAAAPHLAKNMTFIHILYATLFMMSVTLNKSKLFSLLLQYSLIISGYCVVMYGFANMFGNVYYKDAVMLGDPDFRITSTFQYGNTYAVYLIGLLFCCLHFIVTSKKWYSICFHALFLAPIIISFWLTFSRGALVSLPLILILCLAAINITSQIQWIIYLGVGFACSIFVINPLILRSKLAYNHVIEKINIDGTTQIIKLFSLQSLQNWSIILLISLISGSIIFLIKIYILPIIDKKTEKFHSFKWNFFIPLAFIFLSAGLFITILNFKILPDSLQSRIERINLSEHSAFERITFFEDSIKLIKLHPVIGSGGGAWASLYESIQSYPYVSRQAHNFILQYFIEVGFIGVIIFLLLIVAVYYLFFKKYFTVKNEHSSSFTFYLYISIAIIIHSLLDFNMSYVYIGSLLFISLGGLTSSLDSKINFKISRYYFGVPIIIISIVVLVFNGRFYAGSRYYKEAFKSPNFNQVISKLDKALTFNHNHPDYILSKANIYFQAYNQTQDENYILNANNLLSEIKKLEPNNRTITEFNINLLLAINQNKEALQIVNDALNKYPWDLNLYDKLISINYQLWNSSLSNKDQTMMEVYYKSMVKIINELEQLRLKIVNLPSFLYLNRPFEVTTDMYQKVGYSAYIHHDYQTSSAYLKESISKIDIKKDQTNYSEEEKQQIRFYLAAAILSKKNDEEIYNSFISKFPSEKNEIDYLINN